MRTSLKPLTDRYPASRKDHRSPDSYSDWESQMITLTLSQFHVLRDSIGLPLRQRHSVMRSIL